jgi:eukaryotic-like serine/threonine-protein kinase
MNMTSGTRLGPYEILEPTGSGGMGDVYRARDIRLNRDVAVKTIKGPFTERFEREAHAISALNHPNICTLYDVGEHAGSGYLVMEYIDGRPIAGALPVEQAIAYGVQICEALHAAHRKGIVHRDLKPANILLTKQGIKLLDFGLAKLGIAGGSAPASGAGPADASDHATVAALTGAHTVVGTPQYMAPEQIEGREVDARSDIFAFGCVLYEMLTGHRAFEGKSASTVMAAVLATTPRPLQEVLPLTPPALERIVARCLAKDPEDRWQTARDITAELQWVAQGGSRVGLSPIVAGRRRMRESIAWAGCALAAIAALGFAIAWMRRAPEPPALVRFPLLTPDGLSTPSPPAVSPDGRTIAFSATNADGKTQVWVRPLDALEPRVLNGTEGVLRPFWSPDSRFLAFIAGGKLKKVDIAGGPPQIICDAPTGSDGSWSAADVILFDGRGDDPIWRVRAAGGVAQVAIGADPAKGRKTSGWPEFLPDGRHFLFTSVGTDDAQTLTVGALDSKDETALFKTTSRVVYADPGYLLYVREQTLVAQRFNPRSLALSGEPVPIGEGLGVDTVGLASFSVSRTGVLTYRAGDAQGRRLLWIDRSGKEVPAIEAEGNYRDTWLSPDGKRLVFDMSDAGERGDLWMRDLVRGVTSRFTFDTGAARDPLWSPDGRQIVFTSRLKGPGDLFVKDASGTRDAEELLVTPELKLASDWSRDGAVILFSNQGKQTGWDIWALPLAGDRKPFPIVKTKFDELFATFSPDGRYVAYASNESGRGEVYVQEFPQPRNKWQISTEGGIQPFWRADGRELFYRAASRLMSVPVEISPTFTAGAPAQLFPARFANLLLRGHYRPTPDGQRFLVNAALSKEAVQPAAVVLNWTAALRK